MSKPKRITLPSGKVRWLHRFYLPRDWETGRPRPRQVTCMTSAACLERERAIRAEDARLYGRPQSAATLATCLHAYIDHVARLRGVREKQRSTRTTYTCWARHILPALGEIRLDRLTPGRIQAWVVALTDAGAAPSSIENYGNLLRAALNHAVATETLTRSPLRGVVFPHVEEGQKPVWTREELDAFLAVARTDEFHPIWTLAAFAGLREGEAIGLRWPAVDLDAGCLAVTISERAANARGTKPKSERVRMVWLDADTVAELAAHHAEQAIRREEIGPRHWRAEDRVCTASVGARVQVATLRAHMLVLCARAGVPYITFHGLRRTHVTRLAAAGWDVGMIAKRVGHSDERVTRRHYFTIEADVQRRLAEGVREAMLPADAPRRRRGVQDAG